MSTRFASRLRALLAEHGLSARAFSRQAGVDETFIAKILRNERTPPLAAVPHWLDLLNVPVADRDGWLEDASLCHAPPLIQDLVERLRRQLGEVPLRADAAEPAASYQATPPTAARRRRPSP